MTDERPSRVPSSPRLIIGLIIIAFGVSMLADNFGWFSARVVMRSVWPLALVAIGIAMARESTPRNRPWGWIFIVVGVWNVLDNLGVMQINVWHVLFPAILLFAGGTLVWRARHEDGSSADSRGASSIPRDEPAEFTRSVAFMSYSDIRPISRPFHGADLSAIMGGVKLDLRDARIEGDEATLDLFAFWGGIEILLPPEWTVHSRVTTFIGAFFDSRRPTSVVPTKTLIVRGTNIMSGIEVKN
jgi:predicted membrane protein